MLRYLAATGLPVMWINPRQARAFAQAMGSQAKTDPLDTTLLARQAQVLEATLYQPQTAQAQALQKLVKRRTRLVAQRGDDRRRLAVVALPKVQANIRHCLALLDQQIPRHHPGLPELNDGRTQRVSSVSGIGPVSVANLLAHLLGLGHLHQDQIAALVGVAPYNADRGSKKHKTHLR